MILNYFWISIWWCFTLQLHFLCAARDNEHVHIKVHIPHILQKHVHHRSVSKHHFRPKKLIKNHESLSISLDPTMNHPMLSAPSSSKYSKLQAPHTIQPTWDFESPTPFIYKKSKYSSNPILAPDTNDWNNYYPDDYFSKYSKLKTIEPSIKNFQINVPSYGETEKYPKYNNNFEDEIENGEYSNTEEEHDSSMEHFPTANDASLSSSMAFNQGVNPEDYYQMPADPSSYSTSWMHQGKYNKRPNTYGDDESIVKPFASESKWRPQQSQQSSSNQYFDWDNNSYNTRNRDFGKIKNNGKNQFGNNIGSSISFSNYEPPGGSEFEPNTFTMNDFRTKKRKPKKKTKPKWSRFPTNVSYRY